MISGWSDSVNVRTVQVYNPATNRWALASSLPDKKTAAVFGGCGTIVGDTIYVLGGARFEKFYPASRSFYKGAINRSNPLEITWYKAGEYPGELRYRSAAYSEGNKIYFVGGSNETYNYNGISYLKKEPVEPNATALLYSIESGTFIIKPSSIRIMDLRNVVEIGRNHFIVGGMKEHQKVTDEVILLKNE
ncbi:MAG: hypothetical protein JSS73_14780 [Bacteroidetes bacterium]|nr:hypothetical protein [Bacteroidota bacterium]